MTTLIITEKPSQARNVIAAIGSGNGVTVLPAQGHLFRLEEPDEVKPEWSKWTTEILYDEARPYKLKEDPTHGKGDRIKRIKEALKTASTVIIATDCDREGQAIGEDIVRYYGFNGRVLRAMFNNEDPVTLKNAISTARPNAEYLSLYEAADARRRADLMFNLSLTRVVNLCMFNGGPRTKTKGIGRVRTPTFGLVCRRELEIQNFKPREYFVISAVISDGKLSVTLTHKTTNETRVFSKEEATKIQEQVANFKGSVSVKTERKKAAPEKPMDLPTLQKRAGKWGWSPKKTLEIAQALYDTHKISSYPRAETRYLPNIMEAEAAPMLDGLKLIYQIDGIPSEPVIRRGKNGVYSDEGISGASHTAVIPNVNKLKELPSIYKTLNSDERRLFDLIAKSFIAAVFPDYIYDKTTIEITPESDLQFTASGSVPVSLGWKAVFAAAEETQQEDEIEETGNLPSIQDGALIEVIETDIATKTTVPPSRFTEADLIDAMQNAWRYIEDPAKRERLKEAKGIGTPATRDTIIQSLIDQGWLEISKAKGKAKPLVPTSEGMSTFQTLSEHAPYLLDPALTSEMEMRLDNILQGERSAAMVIRQIMDVATKIRDKIISAAPPAQPREYDPTPSEAQIKLVEKLAADKGVDLPEGYKADRRLCSSFIESNADKKVTGRKGSKSTSKPSEKQLAFANSIAQRKKKIVPKAAISDAAKLSAWIEANNK